MKPRSRVLRLLSFLILVVLPLGLRPLAGAGEEPAALDALRTELEGPVNVLLANGSRQSGKIIGWDGQQLRLEVSLGGGSAEVAYPATDLRRIAFPGRNALAQLSEWTRDPARVEEALALFLAFYQQRGAFLSYLDPSELNLFVEYIRFALEHNKPLRAVAMIEVVRPHINDPAKLKALDDAVLLAFFKAGMLDEATAMAKTWIESAPPAGDSALGWRILAEIQFRKEAYEDALWTALYPIAFANQILPEHLDLCYALAIAAAQETRQDPIAERLTREMRARELTWPEQAPLLAPYTPIEPEPESNKAEPEPDTSPVEALDPIQSPSPLDPMQSLPTRIQKGLRPET